MNPIDNIITLNFSLQINKNSSTDILWNKKKVFSFFLVLFISKVGTAVDKLVLDNFQYGPMSNHIFASHHSSLITRTTNLKGGYTISGLSPLHLMYQWARDPGHTQSPSLIYSFDDIKKFDLKDRYLICYFNKPTTGINNWSIELTDSSMNSQTFDFLLPKTGAIQKSLVFDNSGGINLKEIIEVKIEFPNYTDGKHLKFELHGLANSDTPEGDIIPEPCSMLILGGGVTSLLKRRKKSQNKNLFFYQ